VKQNAWAQVSKPTAGDSSSHVLFCRQQRQVRRLIALPTYPQGYKHVLFLSFLDQAV
jgi:hypothetical protein